MNPKEAALRAKDFARRTADKMYYWDIRRSSDLKDISDADIKENVSHLAVILDGNRTYAKSRGVQPELAHKKGGEKTADLLRTFSSLPIETVSLWGFSVNNWARSPREREGIFDAMVEILDHMKDELVEKNVRFRQIGWREPHEALVGQEDPSKDPILQETMLPDRLMVKIKEVEALTKDCKGQNLVLLADYDRSFEKAQANKRASEKPLKPGEEKKLQDDVIFTTEDGFNLTPASLVLRTSEKGPGYHPSGFGEIGDGPKTIWYPIPDELPALRDKTIAQAISFTVNKKKKGGK